MSKLMALLLMALVIGLAACKTQPAPAPAPAESSVDDDLGSLDEVSEEVSVESLDDLDATLGDLENLEI